MQGNLRELLETMTGRDFPVDGRPAYLEEIALIVPHGIRPLTSPGDEPLGDFNCVMYALDIVGCFTEPCSPLGRFYADTAFLSTLIQNRDLVPAEESEGVLAIWSGNGTVKHVGIVLSRGKVVSKWGIGHLYEHGLLEVPQSYGDEIDFFARPTFDQVEGMM